MEAFINQNKGLVGHPLKGSITITHNKNEMVDAQSFSMDGKSLDVQALQQVPMTTINAETLISIYGFELPAKTEKGLFILSPITVSIGGKKYKSAPASYEVTSPSETYVKQSKENKLRYQDTDQTIIFRLQEYVQGPSTIYPGQRLKFLYRILYNRNIDLAESKLPLLHTNDFRKIGDVYVKDYQQDNLTVQDLTLDVEAYKPGTFKYGSATIQGYAYQINKLGQKTYYPDQLEASAQPVEVVVHPFPATHQPSSFNGALASSLEIVANLKTPSKLNLGDLIELELIVKGPSNLDELSLPALDCQPGFSGFFQLNDLPPLAREEKGAKHFQIEMRPVSQFIKEIPPIEFSAFDPTKGTYLTKHTDSIPIELNAIKNLSLAKATPDITLEKIENLNQWIEETNIHVEPIGKPYMSGIPPGRIQKNKSQSPWVLWMIPLGAFFLYWQWKQKQRWIAYQSRPKVIRSADLLRQAFSTPSTQAIHVLTLLRNASLLRLKERGMISSEEDINQLPPGEIRSFITFIDSLLYGPSQKYDINLIRQQAFDLLRNL